MIKSIQIATQALLDPAAIDQNVLEAVLGRALGRGIDSADIYLQSSMAESWLLEDSIVKQADYSVDRGFGLRVLSGEKTGFAYADTIDHSALIKAAGSAKSIIHSTAAGVIHVGGSPEPTPLYPTTNPLQSAADQDKVDLLKKIDQMARQADPRVQQVIVELSSEHDVVMVCSSDGTFAADIRPMVHLNLQVVVEHNGRKEQGAYGFGGRSDLACCFEESTLKMAVKTAVDQALTNLEAIAAPAGLMPVVLAPGWPAILLHEAIGHGLEGDFNRKGVSAFAGRMGEQVATELCTVVDDGTLSGRRGSLTIDDEGSVSQCTVLIEQGRLKNYMQDKHNASLMGMQPTGNGRRESYAHLPLPRMTNTYMLPGQSDPQDIIASVEQGLYAVDFAGGQVDITSGKFVFSMREAYLIENGRLTAPVKGATIIGSGPDVLKKVSMVGHDLELDRGIGTCGKAGQSVPVGVGQPTVKIDEITVGGSK